MRQYLQRRSLVQLGLIGTALMLGACKLGGGGGTSSSPLADRGYQATIERTTYGIPHITAEDFGGAGYGHGYAIAEDNLCVLADAFVTFRGERSRFFGPDAPASEMSTFGTPPNLEADFFFRFIVDDHQVARFRDAQTADVLELLSGFTAGYNRYVREIRDGQHPGRHEACRDAEWLVTTTEDDHMRRLVSLNLAASSANWVEEIASAQPPAATASAVPSLMRSAPPRPDINPERFRLGRREGIGSNTYAFGSDTTETGNSLLFANPHWYSAGIDRFYQVHMTVPGKMDIFGASIMGSPMVQMGFNDHIAWAHTVSTAYRFTLYQLQLVSGDPTRYVHDGVEKALEATELTVEVRQQDGSLTPVSRTLYRSSYGPMINLAALGLPWNEQIAFTLRDVNLENTRAFENFFAWNQARSLSEFFDITRQQVGIPWVNTTAIGRGDGRALYSDITAVPNVPDSMLPDCLAQPFGPIVLQVVPGLPLLDGSRSACDWRSDADSRQPGAFGPSRLPHLFTTDYVANMNDSHWLSNPDQPLTGFDGIIGRENYQQTLRTRLGHIMVRERLAGLDGLPGDRASSENIREIVLNSRVYSAELLKDNVLDVACTGTLNANEQQACDILTNWDNTGELDAVGAHIWTRFWETVQEEGLDLYATPFDAAQPLDTPSGLNPTISADIRTAFSAAVASLVSEGIPLNARLGDVQFFPKPNESIPQFGGEGSEGYFTVLRNSHLHVVDFPEDGPVRGYTLLSGSQSTDPASPHYADYSRAYSEKQWHALPFTREQIEAARISTTRIEE